MTCLGGVLVVVVAVVTVLPTPRSDFVSWDDVDRLLTNSYCRGLGWINLRWIFTDVDKGHWMPVSRLTPGLD